MSDPTTTFRAVLTEIGDGVGDALDGNGKHDPTWRGVDGAMFITGHPKTGKPLTIRLPFAVDALRRLGPSLCDEMEITVTIRAIAHKVSP